MIGEDVDREVEAQARAIAADRGRAQGEYGEIRTALGIQHVFAHRLELRIIGQGFEDQILGHVLLFLDAVDAGGGGVDEAFDTGGLGGAHQRLETIEIDRLAERGVEVEGRIVRDAGQMNDRVAAFERLRYVGRVAQIALYLGEVAPVRQIVEFGIIEIEIEHGHLMAVRQQLRDQSAADIAGAAGNHD